jgi:chromosome segregation protein
MFENTLKNANDRLTEVFGKLFGGGTARLVLTDEDPLTAGVAIHAQPPGKRTKTNQLSGGEKALAAIAFIFAMFELNPSPVCVLDEVDAPLDPNNVNRFTQLIKEMSEDVQFLIITHNQATMRMADSLIGVTMQEAGVSRLVSVDLETALESATE